MNKSYLFVFEITEIDLVYFMINVQNLWGLQEFVWVFAATCLEIISIHNLLQRCYLLALRIADYLKWHLAFVAYISSVR